MPFSAVASCAEPGTTTTLLRVTRAKIVKSVMQILTSLHSSPNFRWRPCSGRHRLEDVLHDGGSLSDLHVIVLSADVRIMKISLRGSSPSGRGCRESGGWRAKDRP